MAELGYIHVGDYPGDGWGTLGDSEVVGISPCRQRAPAGPDHASDPSSSLPRSGPPASGGLETAP